MRLPRLMAKAVLAERQHGQQKQVSRSEPQALGLMLQ
jgi:hypothetical protein